MADLDPDPKNLDQAYDLGFCDGIACGEAVGAENIRLHAALLDRCERCGLHQAVVDLAAMERQRNIWRAAAVVLLLVALVFAGVR